MKRILGRIWGLLLLLAVLVPHAAAEIVEAEVAEIAKYGNLVLNVAGKALFDVGFAYGDMLEATIAGERFEMPLCSSYSDVDTGLPVLRAEGADDQLVIAINMGDMATTAGIAEKEKTEEEQGYRWNMRVAEPVRVEIALSQPGGYREAWLVRQLTRTNEREDYPHLTDESFANFRMIDTTGVAPGRLYRSSSPVNPELGRSAYADRAAQAAGIACVVNLADAAGDIYEGTENAYYRTCRVIYLNLGVDFTSDSFREGLAKGLRFMIYQEGPYLIHCTEGKDRAGFASALLECFMGAKADEVIDDYMETYVNYYGLEPGTEKYDAVVGSNIEKILCTAFGIHDVYTADLEIESRQYMLEELGLDNGEIEALKLKLGGGF